MTDPASSPALGAQPDRTSSVPDTAEPTPAAAAASESAGPSVATFQDEEGRVHYASPHSKATRDAVAAGAWSEVDVDDTFDPTNARVRDVIKYLQQHATEPAEVERVKTAEAAGEDRPTIREWQPGQ